MENVKSTSHQKLTQGKQGCAAENRMRKCARMFWLIMSNLIEMGIKPFWRVNGYFHNFALWFLILHPFENQLDISKFPKWSILISVTCKNMIFIRTEMQITVWFCMPCLRFECSCHWKSFSILLYLWAWLRRILEIIFLPLFG